MKKAEVVTALAEELKVPKTTAAKAFGVVLDCIEGALKKGEKITLVGFGTFSVSQRKARKGRNPRTGKEIKIAAKKVPRFTAGATLKASVNGKAPANPKKAPAKAKKGS